MSDFLQSVKERVVVYDGAMGTNIQFRNPSVDDFWGKEGCNEILVLSRPDIIKEIHADFFRVGCDVVETDTFGATSVVLAEYDLQDKVVEINIAAARIAEEVAQQFATDGKPRFVAGSMGPTTKFPSLGHITFDAMAKSYEEQALGLIEGGVDVLLIETSQDLLQTTAAIAGVEDAMRKAGKRLPVTVQITLEARHDVARHGNWRGPYRTRTVRCRHHRAQLRDGAGRNERCRPLPRAEFDQADLGTSECRTATERWWPRGLQIVAGRTREISQALCRGLRRTHRWRMLRN